METDKPLISILMAVYEPNMDWLREQLISLNEQTYPHLRLYIRDDCSPTVSFGKIQSCIQDCISAFPVILQRNEKNLGSNLTFERLTQEAEGEYFAYCDQDDIWLSEKIDYLYNELIEKKATLICSDMFIIDENGSIVANSITDVRKRHLFLSGAGLAEHLLFSNFVTGCTMLLSANDAKSAIPFCPFYVHDQYMAIYCAVKGSIVSVMKPLIYYRIHGGNQTLEMAGVTDRDSYKKRRIDIVANRMKWMLDNFNEKNTILDTIKIGLEWANARRRNWEHKGGIYTIWKYRRFAPITSMFEIVAAWFPDKMLMYFVELKRKNKV